MASLTDLYPDVISKKTFECHAPRLHDLEVIFATWGMPALTPQQLDLMPGLKMVFYAAGTVKDFAVPFLERGIGIVSAWQANAIPVAEFTLSQILISMKGFFRTDRDFNAPDNYKKLAIAIGKEIEAGVDGIVIGHGTDTLHHTAAALTFMVQNSPVPIVLVGSQRSSDRPSSDAALNLMHACTAAGHGDIAEVMICMFGPTSDEYGFLHKGTRVRKMHSSYRSTFRTIGDTPMATITRKGLKPIKETYNHRRKDRKVTILPYFEEKVSIVYYYPNMQPDIIDSLVENGYKGIVIAGTGLGHVNKPLYPAIERAAKAGVAIYMTVQTLWGYVHMFVYDTGRDLMAKGVVPAENMLPEVAYIKLGWALGQTSDLEEVKRIMLTPINDEITAREPYNGYLVYQGGVPEVEDFIRKVHK